MHDYGHRIRQQLIRPRWHRRLLDWLRALDIDPDPGMPLPRNAAPSADTCDTMRCVKLEAARAWLGCRWRGRPDCTHRYRNSEGEWTTPI